MRYEDDLRPLEHDAARGPFEADGLVRRRGRSQDRRAVRAAVTPLGKERYAAGARQVEKVQAEFTKSISGIDRGMLERVLSALS